ncbi:DUF7503 family protein [Natronocalculus amylovorans]|nr:hypothetical protein [Natronocalculus amylovorans]
MSESTMKSYLADHPRMIGAVFMMLLLLTQAGNAAAGPITIISGP